MSNHLIPLPPGYWLQDGGAAGKTVPIVALYSDDNDDDHILVLDDGRFVWLGHDELPPNQRVMCVRPPA